MSKKNFLGKVLGLIVIIVMMFFFIRVDVKAVYVNPDKEFRAVWVTPWGGDSDLVTYTSEESFKSNMNYILDVMEEYNMNNFLDFKNWNGYLILPILAIILNLLSMVFMKNTQPEQPTQLGPDGQPMNNAASMKMMQYMMPIMMGVFAVLYSAAFTIYMFMSALFSVIFNLIFNTINNKVEKKLEQAALPSHRR